MAILMRTIPDKNVQVWASEPHSNGSKVEVRWNFSKVFHSSAVLLQAVPQYSFSKK